MNKKIIYILIALILVITGCSIKKEDSALEFKKDYESVNGTLNKSGKEHRKVKIDENNPFETISAEDLVEKIENKETFYVYFGDKLCPWCRSVIEKCIEVANKKNIDKIYYVAIWDDEGNEILRDKYTVEDEKAVKTVDGTKSYYKLLEYFDNVLSEYSLGENLTAGEKRIYAPNFIYVKNGESIRLTTAISENQKDAREELTLDILKDEEEAFNNFFE